MRVRIVVELKLSIGVVEVGDLRNGYFMVLCIIIVYVRLCMYGCIG